MIKFLDLYKQYQTLKKEIDNAIVSVIAESAFIGGRFVTEFEEDFATYQQSNHCVGVGNGTDALEIAIEALELPNGSEIIVPANSFIASSEAVTRSGKSLVFCDVNIDDYTIDVGDARKRINPNTSAIMAVHLYGHPCDMDALNVLAQEHGLKIIEDCSQAHGAEYKGRRVGTIGDVGTFSFYPGKNLGACGDAGCIVTCDQGLAEKCRMIANHGRLEKYNHLFEGRNSRLDGIQAAILNVKLKHLDKWIELRNRIAATYLEGLGDLSCFTLPVRQSWARHVYHLFVVQHNQRDRLLEYLKDAGIQCGIHYPIALPDLAAYRCKDIATTDVPMARKLSASILSLPIGEHLSLDQTKKVILACRDFAG